MTDYILGATFYMNFTTQNSTGIPTVLIGTPGVSAIEDNSITPITAGITLTVDIASVVGLNNLEIVATTGNGFESGKEYTLYIDTGTVGGDSRVGEVVGTFTLGRIADLVWDEVLSGSTHNISTSAGKRLRDSQENLGYEGGAVWIDSNNGTAGTDPFENGTAGFPVDTITDAQTIAAGITLTRFEFAPESIFTLLADFQNSTLRGDHWTLHGGGFDISGTNVSGADVDGVFIAATGEWNFRDCHVEITNVTIPPDGHFHNCDFKGNITLGAAGDYAFYSCRSNIAGGGSPNIDFGILGATTVSFREYSGGMEFENMAAGDVVTFEGNGQIIINANCTGGEIHVRGNIKVTDNSGGAVTLDDDAKFSQLDISANILTTALTESYAGNGAEPTLTEAIYAIHQMLMQFGIVGTNYSVRRLDDTSSAFTVVLDSSTDPTDAKRV